MVLQCDSRRHEFNARYATPSAFVGASYPFNEGEWYHMACVYDGSEIRLYVNGRMVGTHSYSGGLEYTNQNLLLFHRNMHISGAEKDHSVRDMRLSNTARYTSDFLPNWELSADSDTVALFRANEGSGTVLQSSVGGYSATIDGQASWGVSGPYCGFQDLDSDGVLAWEDCDDENDSVWDARAGVSETCAAHSCERILNDGYSTGDGVYWLDPDGSGGVAADCDMTIDGGGWTKIFGIETSGPAKQPVPGTLNEGISLAHAGDGFVLPTELSAQKTNLDFSEMRFECEKYSVGRKLHIQTDNVSVIDFLIGDSNVYTVASGAIPYSEMIPQS